VTGISKEDAMPTIETPHLAFWRDLSQRLVAGGHAPATNAEADAAGRLWPGDPVRAIGRLLERRRNRPAESWPTLQNLPADVAPEAVRRACAELQGRQSLCACGGPDYPPCQAAVSLAEFRSAAS
jgi:hypothetical protein